MGPLVVFAALAATKAIKSGADFFSQRGAGNAALRQGEMERELYGQNAALAEKQAADATARGEEAALRQAYNTSKLQGAQVAGIAGQGVKLAGTTAGVVENDQTLGEADRLTILENARRESQGYTMEAGIYRQRGEIAYQAARARKRADDIESIGTLANFAGDMFNLYQGQFGDGGGQKSG